MKTPFILLTLVFYSLASKADTYRPLAFVDPGRPDLQKLIKSLKDFHNVETKSSLRTITTVGGDEMPVFKEIAERVEALQNAEHAYAPFSLTLNPCPATEVVARSCAMASTALKACLEARNPHRYFLNDSMPPINDKSMSSLEGIIRVVVYGLQFQPIPKELVSAEVERAIPVILGKIAYGKLVMNLKTESSKLASNCGTQDISQAVAELNGAELVLTKRQVINSASSLPHPTLTNRERELLTANLYAILWRGRGGGFIKLDGTQKARELYAKRPFQALAELNGLKSGDVGGGMFWALVMKGWGRYFDVGHTAGEEDREFDLAHLVERGLYQVESAIKTLKGKGFKTNDLAIAGLHMASCYDIGWEHLREIKIVPEAPLPMNDLTKGGTSWGEVCWGYALGTGLSRSLLGNTL